MTLDEEKEKARYIHNLGIKKLIIDKLVFGLVVVILGFIASMFIENYKNKLALYIEDHRSQLISDRFFVQKKYEAVTKIWDAHSDMLYNFDRFAYKHNDNLPQNYAVKYKESIINAMNLNNELQCLMSTGFDKKAHRYIALHLGVHKNDFSNWRNYGPFLESMSFRFLNELKKEVGLKYDEKSLTFKIDYRSLEDQNQRSIIEYLDDHHKKWLALQK